ncbi:class I SAM-dependent methyltransferase [Maribacter sp. R77961]|uniref:class I SAM-dependent methyltransferase n=1 Tax=Maribacter sp. R77961 TaxID=3093871 RepID=UPI0037C5816E
MKDFWNERYEKDEFAYGILPNEFFKKTLDELSAGSLLLPAEGEGRNAVYAASKGWNVTAFDYSESARNKAIRLSKENKVSIDYTVVSVLEFKSNEQFDVIGLCYAHFPEEIRKQAHQNLIQFLKPNGIVIFEAFSKSQLGKPSGGPKDEAMLFSIEEIKKEFPSLEFKILKEENIELKEGIFHRGDAAVIRFVGGIKETNLTA